MMNLFLTQMKGKHEIEEKPAILPKTKGSRIIVSDFVEKHGGFLRLSNEEFQHAKECYPGIVPEAQRLLELE